MTLEIRPREDWQDPAQPVTGPAMNLDAVELLPAHYTADDVIPDDVPQYLRNMQGYYLADRGYSVGYNFAIDQTGEAWELRGFDVKCAANKDMNEVTIAVLCMVDGAEAMNAAMVDTFRELGAEAQRRCGVDLLVVGHRDIGSTSCPGDGIYSQVQAGELEPADDVEPTPPTPIPTEVLTMLALDFGTPPPNGDTWWTRLTYTGAELVHVVSPADQLQARGGVPIVSVNETELSALLDTVQTVGASPFGPGGQSPNDGLDRKWVAARGRL